MKAVGKRVQIVILLLLISSYVESNIKRPYFDYFLLDLVWPNSFCQSMIHHRCKEPIPQKFIVDGLWPYKASDRPPIASTRFSFPKTSAREWNFSESLAYIWPALKKGQENLLSWQQEWNKYGVRTNMSAENYFYFAVKFGKQYDDVYDSLLSSGIIAPSDQPYEKEVLYNEFKNVLGSSPMIRCVEYQKMQHLFAISICINTKGVAFDCRSNFRKCGEEENLVIFTKKKTTSLFGGYQDTTETAASISKLSKLIDNEPSITEDVASNSTDSIPPSYVNYASKSQIQCHNDID